MVILATKKNSGHLYWLLIIKIKFPSLIMVIHGQNKIPIDNNYGLSKECLSFITLIRNQNFEIKDTNSYAAASKICRMTITISGKNCISGFVYYLLRANNQRNLSVRQI